MRFLLTLTTTNSRPIIPINYQYPLSAAIYKILQRANPVYASFLHSNGYGTDSKKFKLFTFSDLRVPFQITGDRLFLTGHKALLIVCFHMPDAIENFIRGLFLEQRVDIADHQSKAQFQVAGVEVIPTMDNPYNTSLEDTPLLLKPLSPIVAGLKNEKGYYDYLFPSHSSFADCLLYNWKEKYAALYGRDIAITQFKKVRITVKQGTHARSRLITIKGDTPEATRIRGFMNFSLEVQAPDSALQLVLNAGMGLYNAQGMGCVEVIEPSVKSHYARK